MREFVKSWVDQTRRAVSCALQPRLQVRVAQHGPSVLGKVLHQLYDLVAVLDAVPEHNITVPSNATVGLVEEPRQIFVVFFDGED